MVEKLGKLEEIEKTATDIVGKTIRSLRHQQVSGVVHPASDFSGFGCRFLRRTLTVVFLYWFALLFLAVVVDVANVDVVFVVPFGVVSHRFRFFTVSDCFYLLKKQVHVGRGRHSGPCAIHRIPLHARKSTLVGQPQQVSFFFIKKMIE